MKEENDRIGNSVQTRIREKLFVEKLLNYT